MPLLTPEGVTAELLPYINKLRFQCPDGVPIFEHLSAEDQQMPIIGIKAIHKRVKDSTS
jgi:hypothetical protein